MEASLTVYKASAGSGKTFTLVASYLTLVIENPERYKNILAVTFTNKATEEMKSRIVMHLYGIWKNLPESKSYFDYVADRLPGGVEVLIRSRAKEALRNIIHDYSNFRIETIDSFFQQILNAIAKELELSPNLKVELNDIQVENNAVDYLVEHLKESDKAFDWIMEFIQSNISEAKNWNVINAIKKFGENLFSEKFKSHSDEIDKFVSNAAFDVYVVANRDNLAAARETMRRSAERFYEILAREELDEDCIAKKSRGVASVFSKVKKGVYDSSIFIRTLDNYLSCPENWAPKKSAVRDLVVGLAETDFIPLLKEIVEAQKKYQTASVIKNNLSNLRLLGKINDTIRSLNNEAGRFLLSDTQYLLNKFVKDTDAPFIYEQVGCKIDFIMIDEFQDTSRAQWDNFKILLEECMSRAGAFGNIIVGDVKQSIYRWRSGDWRLLNNISRELNGKIEIENLGCNHRSDANIIAFNNCFFKAAAKIERTRLGPDNTGMAKELERAYADVKQKISGKNHGGYVSIKLLDKENYENTTLVEIANVVRRLLECGATIDDIAILFRNNRDVEKVANYFSENFPDVAIVSEDAFLLSSSASVRIIISAFKLLANPSDIFSKISLVKLYRNFVKGENISDDILYGRREDLDLLLPDAYLQLFKSNDYMPLFELAEFMYLHFGLEVLENETSYLCTFFDVVREYAGDEGNDLDAFIQEWNSSLCGRKVANDQAKGLRMLTIHKSKGLEFKHVIIPFCDWRLEKYNNILWCETSGGEGEMPVVPVPYSSKLSYTDFSGDYSLEYGQNIVDNLNLLYVAFTRPMTSLFVIGSQGGEGVRSQLIRDVLNDKDFKDEISKELKVDAMGVDTLGLPVEFTCGEMQFESSRREESSGNNVFADRGQADLLRLGSYSMKGQFKQSSESVRFFAESTCKSRYENVDRGKFLHAVFSKIRTADDIPGVIDEIKEDVGVFGGSADTVDIARQIEGHMDNALVKDWFSGGWEVFNECSIVYRDTDGKIVRRRPDRVMRKNDEVVVVDFKFGKYHESYKKQIEEYKELLGKMGFENVRGYIWMVIDNKVEVV